MMALFRFRVFFYSWAGKKQQGNSFCPYRIRIINFGRRLTKKELNGITQRFPILQNNLSFIFFCASYGARE